MHNRHCEEPKATKQSTLRFCTEVDCFAPLAMTGVGR